MKQRAVTIVATYLSKRPLGRIVGVRKVGDDDYILAIEDVRDGGMQLIHTRSDLGLWLQSFRRGECARPAAGICARCDELHVDRDVDGELLPNCIRCASELVWAAAEMFLGGTTRDDA